MIRYSTKRFNGDNFNFNPSIVSNGIHSKGLWKKLSVKDALDKRTMYQQVFDSSSEGIIVDENVDLWTPSFRKYSLATVQALSMLNKPKGKTVSIFHSARLSMKLAKAYKEPKIDYIVIESYWPWKSQFMMWLFFKGNYRRAKRAGILNKIVFLLGINQNQPKIKGDAWSNIPWANDVYTLFSQIGYVKTKMPGIAGIGFFEENCTNEQLKAASLGSQVFE